MDPNRSPLEIDKTMWENNNLDNLFDANSPKVQNGIGVFQNTIFLESIFILQSAV